MGILDGAETPLRSSGHGAEQANGTVETCEGPRRTLNAEPGRRPGVGRRRKSPQIMVRLTCLGALRALKLSSIRGAFLAVSRVRRVWRVQKRRPSSWVGAPKPCPPRLGSGPAVRGYKHLTPLSSFGVTLGARPGQQLS